MIGRPPNSPLFPYTTLFRSVGQAGDVVVGLDRRRSGAPPGLDHVRVERPLHEKARVLTAVLGREPAGLLLEDADELAADRLALGLGLGDAGQPCQEALLRIDGDERHLEGVAECADHLLALVLS